MPMPVMTAPLLQWALWYASEGHPVFPCHTPVRGGCSCRQAACPSIGKHPRITGGLRNASTDPTQITRWWTQWPLANIALRTGDTFWVLDVDPRKGGDTELTLAEHAQSPLPATPHSKTGGGGEHIVFAPPQTGTIRNTTDLLPGVDVRGEGGYIVVPPSLHASGQRYAWDVASDLEDTPLAQAPTWLLDLYHVQHYDPPTSPEAPIPNGQRNNTLSRMAFAMRRAGMSLKELHAGLEAVNVARCLPPLDAEELLLIVEGKRPIGPDPILRVGTRRDDVAPPELRQWPALIAADAIMQANHPTPEWLVHGLIPEGLTIVGGLPKVAKSYFAYDIALAAAGKGLGLGHFAVERGRAAYLAIEDDPGDTQQRIRELRPGAKSLEDLFFLHGEDVPTISGGLVEYLREKVQAHDLSLVIVDPLSYVYDPKQGKQADSFREAKDMLLPLRQLARELHFSLLLIDHRRKQGKDDADVFQTLYGSVAKYAVADVLIMMVRRGDEVMLHCVGRKIKDQVIACEFTFTDGEAAWKVQGLNEVYASESLKGKILAAFKEAERLTQRRTLNLADVLLFADLDRTPQMKETVRVIMFRMCREGLLIKADRNMFLLTGDDDSQGVIV